MKRFLTKLWDKMNEPQNERVLIVLLPCLTLLLALAILAPRIVYFAREALVTEAVDLELPPLPTSEPEDLESIFPTEKEIFVDTPSPSPTPDPTPDSDDGKGWINVDGKTYYLDKNGTHAIGLTCIDGRLYYFDQNGVKAESLGIDVSFYNKGINWDAVKAQGIDFAILRAGGRGWETGLIYDDDCFTQNLLGAKKAGIDIGVYFYSTAITAPEAINEAAYVLELLGGTELDYPIFFDVEQSGEYPYGRSDRLSKAMRAETIRAFCSTVESRGYDAGVYSGHYFFRSNLDYPSLREYYIWLANYTKYNRLPNFPGRYDMWQFTDRGTVNGIRGMVDMNVIFKD